MGIVAVCGSYHKTEIELMIDYAREEAAKHSLEVSEIVWAPGSMEVPLALKRALTQNSKLEGAICLGIIEKGETQHGAAMGPGVIQSIIDLQLELNKPIGLGIIGPGAEERHIEPRLEPHARAAVNAVVTMNNL